MLFVYLLKLKTTKNDNNLLAVKKEEEKKRTDLEKENVM